MRLATLFTISFFLLSPICSAEEYVPETKTDQETSILNEELRQSRVNIEDNTGDISSLQTTQSDQGDSIDTLETSKLDGLSSYATDDSESNAMLASTQSVAHAYLAQTDGFVCWSGQIDAGEQVTAYVDTDSDPVTGGVVVGNTENGDSSNPGYVSLAFFVPNGQYFEILVADTDATTGESLAWISYGTLAKPIDQD